MCAIANEGIGPHRQIRKLCSQFPEFCGNLAFTPLHLKVLAQKRRAARQFGQYTGHHRLEYLGYARHDMHIAHCEARRGRDRIVDQAGPFGNAGHALAGLVKLQPCAVVMRLQQRHRIGPMADRHAKGSSNRIGGDVIMRRPDPATGKDMVIARAQRIDAGHDRPVVIGHYPRFHQADAMPRQFPGQKMHVRVARAPR